MFIGPDDFTLCTSARHCKSIANHVLVGTSVLAKCYIIFLPVPVQEMHVELSLLGKKKNEPQIAEFDAVLKNAYVV